MKYDPDATKLLIDLYEAKTPTDEIAAKLNVPIRSVIAKLSSLGIYVKKPYLNKQGQVPIKKEEYIARIASLLQVNEELLESLEKANKNVLILLEKALKDE